jgi:hypothetical protein
MKSGTARYAHDEVVPVMGVREFEPRRAAVAGTDAFRMLRVGIEVADTNLYIAIAAIVNRET